MKRKDWILLLFGSGILTSLIVLILRLPPVSPKPQISQATSTDDHHKPQPANEAVFKNLLNKPAPDFSLVDYNGRTVNLKSLQGKNVLLFFNEGLMCYPACWNQIVAFGKDAALKQAGVTILNITVDTKSQWAEAIAKMPELAPATVLFDKDKKASASYGVLDLASSMHRGQFPGHSYVLIDKNGEVKFVWDDPQMAVRNSELLAKVNELPK
ncbi:redoxin domain-containing protein [Candidatus Collierbacteria bacterium]|nr:redoxin domain-containing protein [Candidatus Collierbacteria bacterium]